MDALNGMYPAGVNLDWSVDGDDCSVWSSCFS